jgi:energy-coupling factor transporter ATP-binding protein EcfA2
MQLIKFSYHEFKGEPREWEFTPLSLGGINLIVGKNASGKSRTINVIAGLARILSGGMSPAFISGSYTANFVDAPHRYEYKLVFRDREIISESFTRDDTVLLDRGEAGVGKILVDKDGEASGFIDFQAPTNQLAATSRRDSINHPFFEPLYLWSKGVRHFEFGSTLGKNSIAIIVKNAPPQIEQWDTEAVIKIYKTGDRNYGAAFKGEIIASMNRLQYDITDMGAATPTGIIVEAKNENGQPAQVNVIYVQERALASTTEQHAMSQGMFRALSIIIQTTYAKFSKSASCLIIDDIGEGLDFERSCAMIKLLVEHAENSNLQLIMSTNDRYIMNAVPLKYWKLIRRDKGTCEFYTSENSSAAFDEFRFTGLSNFDFFSGDFINQEARKE